MIWKEIKEVAKACIIMLLFIMLLVLMLGLSNNNTACSNGVSKLEKAQSVTYYVK